MLRHPSLRLLRAVLCVTVTSAPLLNGCGHINLANGDFSLETGGAPSGSASSGSASSGSASSGSASSGGRSSGGGSSSSDSGSAGKPAAASASGGAQAAEAEEPAKKYPGKVLLGDKPLTTAGAGKPTATFKPGDTIYARLEVPQTIRDAANSSGSHSLLVRVALNIDGDLDQQPAKFKLAYDAPEVESSALAVEIVPDPATAQRPTLGANLASMLTDLKPGVHTVQVMIGMSSVDASSWNGAGVATFKYDTTGGTAAIEAQKNALVDRAIAMARMPKAAKKDGALEKSMQAALVTADWKEKPLRAVVIQPDWTVFRNRVTGILLSRTIQGYVAVKRVDGTCTMFFINFVQVHQGAAWGKTAIESVYDNDDLGCDNVGK